MIQHRHSPIDKFSAASRYVHVYRINVQVYLTNANSSTIVLLDDDFFYKNI